MCKVACDVLKSLYKLDKELFQQSVLQSIPLQKFESLMTTLCSSDAGREQERLHTWVKIVNFSVRNQRKHFDADELCALLLNHSENHTSSNSGIARRDGRRKAAESNTYLFSKAAYNFAHMMAQAIRTSLISSGTADVADTYSAVAVSCLEELRDQLIVWARATGPYLVHVGGVWESSPAESSPRSGKLEVRCVGSAAFLRFWDDNPYGGDDYLLSEYGSKPGIWFKSIDSFNDYVNDLFATWKYDTGESTLSSELSGRAEWQFGAKGARSLKNYAEEAVELLTPLLKKLSYSKILALIQEKLQVATSLHYSHRIHWAYIKELDDIVKNIRVALSQKGGAAGQEPLVQGIKVPKEASKEALQAYDLYYATDKTQAEVAEIMTEQLKPDKPYKQWQVSRLIKSVKQWRESRVLPVDSIPRKPDIMTMDPTTLAMGQRTDGRVTGDPRHKGRVYRNGEADE